jgi:hypothetical protein
MSKKSSVANVEKVERRRHWRDRRNGNDRRSNGRLQLTGTDCRSGLPRRASDLSGELAEGEIWWNKDKDVTRYE